MLALLLVRRVQVMLYELTSSTVLALLLVRRVQVMFYEGQTAKRLCRRGSSGSKPRHFSSSAPASLFSGNDLPIYFSQVLTAVSSSDNSLIRVAKKTTECFLEWG